MGQSSAKQVDEFDVYKCKLRATHPYTSLSQDLEPLVETLKGIVVLYVYMRRWSMVRNDGAWLVLSGLYKEEHVCEALSKQRSLTRRSIKRDEMSSDNLVLDSHPRRMSAWEGPIEFEKQ